MLKALDGLPSELRATTDHEVGTFVQSLLGARRQERKKALADALERADQVQAESGTRQAMHATAQEPVSTITNANGQGSISASGLTSGEIEQNPFASNRRTMAAIGVAGFLLVLSGITAYLLADTAPAPTPPEPGSDVTVQQTTLGQATATPKPEATATAEEKPDPKGEKPKDEAPGEEAAPKHENPDSKEAKPDAPRPAKPYFRPTPKPSKPKPAGGNSWDKQNPGF
jgi:hypothetical protein